MRFPSGRAREPKNRRPLFLRSLRRLMMALALSTALVAPAHAAPLVGLAGLAGAGIGSAIVSTLVSTGISLAIGYVAELFSPKPKTAQRDPTQVTYGDRVPRSGAFGIVALGGHKVYINDFDDSKKTHEVYILADGWCDSLAGIYVNGRQYDLVSKTVSGTEHHRYWVDGFDDLIDIRFHDGRPGQAADTEILAENDDLDSHFTYSNMCYVAVTITSDSDKFGGSRPQFQWILKGLRVYDIRKDGTAGGTGSHRFNDPSTWEWSANTFVCAYHYLRGFYFNSQRSIGVGSAAADIDYDAAIAAMNVADETVTRPDDTTRPRYECHLAFDDTQEHDEVLHAICDSAAGFFAERNGKVALFAGKAQTPVATITDYDFVGDEDITFSPKRPGSYLYTGVQGTYTHSSDFIATPYTAIEPSAYVTADGKSKPMALDLSQIQDAHQAYSVARIKLFENRMQATASGALDVKDMEFEVGDWITWNSANSLRGNRTYRVVKTWFDYQALRQKIGLAEISSSVYADDSTTDDIAEPVRVPTQGTYLTAVSGLALDPGSLTGSSGEVLPYLEITYDAVNDPAVSSVLLEYRVVGTTDTIKTLDPSPGDGTYRTSQGVRPGQTYEVRAKLDTLPGRTVDWTDWVEASGDTPDASVSVADGSVTYDKLDDPGKASRDALLTDGAGSLPAIIADLQAQIENASQGAANNLMTSKTQRDLLSVAVGSLAAAVLTESHVEIGDNEALASYMTQVAAQINNATAGGLFKIEAGAAGSGVTSSILQYIFGAYAGDYVEAGERLEILDDHSTRKVIYADRFVYEDSDGNEIFVVDKDGNMSIG